MRLLIVQYAGDYREAFYNLTEGRGETYYAQQYSVDTVSKLAEQVDEVATLSFLSNDRYNEVLPNGVRAIGAGFHHKVDSQTILEIIKAQNPTHIVLRTPNRTVLQWAIKNNVQVVVTLADSFNSPSLRDRVDHYFLANLLNHPQISWVANHGVTASQSLESIGVNPEKIIPWDWPHAVTPDLYSPKTLRQPSDCWKILYAGHISEAKGLGDVLEAIALLKARHFPVHLKIAGKGDIDFFQAKVHQLQIEDCVEFLGMVKNTDVIGLMRDADLVTVPSHHDYPEGFPMTIYESLCSRTPIVASNHPMFVRQLRHEQNAMIFPDGEATACALQIETILTQPALYEKISYATHATWKNLQVPVKWGDLLTSWLKNSPEDQKWLFQHRLSSGRYGNLNVAAPSRFSLYFGQRQVRQA
ncbi:MAG: glycosyltransferase [Timaviella obliquedivisa GSE-PSE-MK23-08B]|jgi:glycosyltransferase involved in cell wall biosynthesis|nr:glycosyltransferase [Timaviella obliquedivisa GSE-PSE-MK23-08B]